MTVYVGDVDGLSWSDACAKVRGDLWRPGNSLPDDVVNRALHASILKVESECPWLWQDDIVVPTPDRLEDALALPNATLQVYQDTVIAGACARLPLRYLKNADEAARQQAVFEDDIQRMQTTRADRVGGFVEPDTWGMGCG